MAITPKKLYQGQLSDEVKVLYTAVGNKTIVKNILISKADSDTGIIDLHFVPSGSAHGEDTKIISEYEVTAPLVSIDISLVMENGDSIRAINKDVGKVNLYISGVEVI